MLTVTLGDQSYRFVLDEQLKTLTGRESMQVEEYLGGWAHFRDESNATRSTIVLIWLAKRSAGVETSFAEIEEIPGLMFGGALELDDDGDGEPEDPMTEPGRPLASSSESNGSSNGPAAAASIPPLSASSGVQ